MHTVTEYDQGRGLREGMPVYSADGVHLGKIVALGEDSFLIEKGLFFKEDHVAHFGQITRIRDDGSIELSSTADQLPAEIMGTELHSRPAPER